MLVALLAAQQHATAAARACVDPPDGGILDVGSSEPVSETRAPRDVQATAKFSDVAVAQ